MAQPVIEVKDLRTYFKTSNGIAKAVDGVSFSIEAGATFALVGESGCGKSVTALSIIQLISGPAGYIAGGSVLLNGRNIVELDEVEKRKIRGARISMIFQEPMTSLNPVFTVGEQVCEAIRLHQKKTREEAKRIALDMFVQVKLPDPDTVFNEYPHRLSGGMRQRVMIAMALACRPDLLIADEPTTALDVTIQDEIVKLISELKTTLGTAVLLITHNMALVYNNADTIGVMYAGKLVECAPAKEIFRDPLHPYTVKLLRSIPGSEKRGLALDTISGSVPPATDYPAGCHFAGRCPRQMQACASVEPLLLNRAAGHLVACHLHDDVFMAAEGAKRMRHERNGFVPITSTTPLRKHDTLMEVKGLKMWYPVRKGIFRKTVGHVKAVDGIDIVIKKGETVALVGESGCGKTTAGKALLRLLRPTAGEINLGGVNLAALPESELRSLRSRVQMIFQDPYSSLNPRLTIKETVEEGLVVLKPAMSAGQRLEKVLQTLERVGLGRDSLWRYPHEFSGGQRQRIGIARALAVDPEFIVCDEAVSALDVSVQAQILNLLKSIQADTGIAFLFITHDLAVVEYIADEVAVMYGGRIVERGTVDEIFLHPKEEYTKRLLAAVPRIDKRLIKSWKLPGKTTDA